MKTPTTKEINEMKRTIKKATGKNMNEIEITNYSDNMIGYKYFATNYDRTVNKYTHETIVTK